MQLASCRGWFESRARAPIWIHYSTGPWSYFSLSTVWLHRCERGLACANILVNKSPRCALVCLLKHWSTCMFALCIRMLIVRCVAWDYPFVQLILSRMEIVVYLCSSVHCVIVIVFYISFLLYLFCFLFCASELLLFIIIYKSFSFRVIPQPHFPSQF